MIDQTKLPNNREDWLEMVKLWKESGLTKEAFCREMSIKNRLAQLATFGCPC
ncbi:hypothetical protein PsalMR5_04194 (plasmid) [Piscirickettsia salmonis]|uniref:IS66 family insertion sequence element accessory protein TnpA n=1 Tax=Piscirickettsia salmonis TaxID=1238 RepID=UPI0012BAD903|nr:hypothetical protein [Piscirickettsia salmonis]QGP54027.1 hypothetical protein PsalSR1_01455 [Piscirickettsia salmonis]QGP56701.1 hypothetical protein PsalSR1_04190 [Piscirickettsia salmonis]QGP60076.1 hypothetical protein PsalBI1_02677 [Piscirickettsia salmonis]QGP61684.1 hypothetical protein PsalBI1_04326 [Piscirickettsia salmonis]QGP63603.1 hypothetical protein PsalMR5_01463 [Piscirickettsia salmonis]